MASPQIHLYCNHHYWGGLQNNGGSKTIIRFAETIQKMKHKVRIIAPVDKFTYFRHKVKVRKAAKPGTARIIACSVSDLEGIGRYKGPHKYYWCRGWEYWQTGDSHRRYHNIVRTFTEMGGKVICNSSWLVERFAKLGIESELCYNGYDPVWAPRLDVERDGIGCLFHKRKTKNYRLFRKIKSHFRDRYKYYEIGRRPASDGRLRKTYSRCKMWFAPTELEGFHNIPMEANLCGALVVCNQLDSNGMGDYAWGSTGKSEKGTAMVYRFSQDEDPAEKAIELMENPKWGCIEVMQKVIREKIGTREKNVKRFLELINVK